MDLLEPMDGSEQENEGKVILHTGLSMDEQSIGSDEVDDLSLQITADDQDVQYSFRNQDGLSTVTYGVLKVENDSSPQLISTSNFTNATVPQVITSNLNGHLYVIGNATDVFVSQPRSIAPKAAAVAEAGCTSNLKNLKKAKQAERRRATHNEVERRRRDKINNWITKLANIIPESAFSGEMKSNGPFDGQSKGGILAKACEYITELRDCGQKLEEREVENKYLTESLELVKKKNLQLEKENKMMRDILSRHGISLSSAKSNS